MARGLLAVLQSDVLGFCMLFLVTTVTSGGRMFNNRINLVKGTRQHIDNTAVACIPIAV